MTLLEKSYAAYVNLDSRDDRRILMDAELYRVKVSAKRVAGHLPRHYPEAHFDKMRNTTPGAIGCYMAQLSILSTADNVDKHAFVMEDDLVFCDDIHERLAMFDRWSKGKEWDILWLGATYHLNPVWHRRGHPNRELPCDCELGIDWEPTDNKNIVRTYGCWSTYAYIVNKYSILKVKKMLIDILPFTIGIDYSMIAFQPKLKTYSITPGCVKQYDNLSNIGNGITKFSGFETLGNHWWKKTL